MMVHVTVYHNTDGRFTAFRREHRLLAAFAFSRALPQDATAEQLAEWTFCLCNADLKMLVDRHPTIDTASTFLLACRYRLQRVRSLSVGDVVRISTPAAVYWLACDGLGWTAITPPPNVAASQVRKTSTNCGSDRQPTESQR
ncbi:hypothetical protein [Actinoplanes sp. NBRC 103695]|uniref:hypothetical protein n=1 Tax=Actinoplanes sp. NBRC 103695 TaxID=3032202 RepID=UPI0024A0B7AD|nr:hypothetical protein [Actinoplanes sp. NBRC 103695]GLZ00794.1 hypothetical protein Acsp02_80460 [Actinoplanes sp. NBRC 103695]